MLKVLLPVDGSASSTRATETLVDMLGWCKSTCEPSGRGADRRLLVSRRVRRPLPTYRRHRRCD